MSQTATLTVPYSGSTLPGNPWWVRLEQIPPVTDVADVSSAADMLDELYKTEPCTTVEQPEEAEELTTEDVEAAASKTLDIVACLIEPDGSCEVQIKVIRSHQIEPYRLHVAGGSVVSTVVVNEETTQYVSVSSATEATLEYPVVNAFSPSWMADINTDSGNRPTINRNGNVLYWSESATGTLQAAYLTVYDLVTVKVDGVNGEPGDALIRVVFHAMAEELTPELPEPAEMDRSLCRGRSVEVEFAPDRVTCYKKITRRHLCECSKSPVTSGEHLYRSIIDYYDEIVPCPSWLTKCHNGHQECMAQVGSETVYEYVKCPDDDPAWSGGGRIGWEISSPEYYKETCCTDPTVALPQCDEKTDTYSGGRGIENGKEYYQLQYGKSTRFRPVSPPGGVCGEHITRQVVESNNCCAGVPALAWDASVSPEVMAPNSSAIFGVTGGRPPFLWMVSGGLMIDDQMDGHGFYFANGSNHVYTEGRQLYVVTSPSACGSVTLTVEDGCSTATGSVRCTQGRWQRIGNFRTRDMIATLPGVYQCVTNMYITAGTKKITQYSGPYALSGGPHGPVGTEGQVYDIRMHPYCSATNLPKASYMDPVIGLFSLPGLTGGNHYVDASDGAYWRLGYYDAAVTNTELYIHQWVCA